MSVFVNLLPSGVGTSIAQAAWPKVYIPSVGVDPEQKDMTLGDCVDALIELVRADAGEVPVSQILSAVLLDTHDAPYARPPDVARVEALGVEVVRLDLVKNDRICPQTMAQILVSLD